MYKIFLYGILNASENYRVARYECISGEAIKITDITRGALNMRINYPNIERIYAIDDRSGLYWEYKGTIKKNSIESYAIFKDTLEKEGIRIF